MPGLDIYIEAVVLFATALVSYASELDSPRHITFAITCGIFTEPVQWTSGGTAYGTVVTATTFFHCSPFSAKHTPTLTVRGC